MNPEPCTPIVRPIASRFASKLAMIHKCEMMLGGPNRSIILEPLNKAN